MATSSSPSRFAAQMKISATKIAIASVNTPSTISAARFSSQLREREAAMTPRRHEEVLAMRRLQDRVEPLVASALLQRQLHAAGEHSVHREAVAVEVVARRV